jgi:hypothetical protein
MMLRSGLVLAPPTHLSDGLELGYAKGAARSEGGDGRRRGRWSGGDNGVALREAERRRQPLGVGG